jgi:hypothetical protein
MLSFAVLYCPSIADLAGPYRKLCDGSNGVEGVPGLPPVAGGAAGGSRPDWCCQEDRIQARIVPWARCLPVAPSEQLKEPEPGPGECLRSSSFDL